MSLNLTQSTPINLSNFGGYPLDSFCIPSTCAEDLESVLIPGGLLRDRIKRLALDIATDYREEPFIAVCILRGGYEFFTALLNDIREVYRLSDFNNVNRLTKHIRIEFVRMTSYQDDKSVKMEVKGIENLKSVKGKNILVIEDVIDTGRSMQTFFRDLKQFQPKSARLACLTVKEKPTVLDFKSHYVGFVIPDKFVVGCNYEYNNFYRDLNHVCVLTDAAKTKYSAANIEQSNF